MKKNNTKGNLSDTGDKRKLGNTPTGKMRGTIDTAYHTAVSDDYTLSTMGKSHGSTFSQADYTRHHASASASVMHAIADGTGTGAT